MKKLCCVLVFFICIGFSWAQEEVDFLLFLRNSSNQFDDEEQAMVDLDNVAEYLMNRNLGSGQIHIYGYAAFSVNDFDGDQLSRERALFVKNELQRRGLREELFADPVAFGEVYIWGNNVDEQARRPNRRVRILVDGVVLTPQAITQPSVEPVADPVEPVADLVESAEDPVKPVAAPAEPVAVAPTHVKESRSRFPWILLLLLFIPLIAGILFFALKSRKKEPAAAEPVMAVIPAVSAEPVTSAEPVASVEPVASKEAIAVAVLPLAPVAMSYTLVNLDEEIRFRAYELYLERYGQNENAYEDWCKAVIEVCARYNAIGYETYPENESWWARRDSSIT